MLPLIRLQAGSRMQRPLGLSVLNQVYGKAFSTSNVRFANLENAEKRSKKKRKVWIASKATVKEPKSKPRSPTLVEKPLDFDFKSQFDDGRAIGAQTTMIIAFPKDLYLDSIYDPERRKIPYIWLRDHCRCGECLNPETMQRVYDVFSAPRNVQPTLVELQTDGLSIRWKDGHQSFYKWSWLSRSLRLKQRMGQQTSLLEIKKHEPFGSSIKNSPPSIDYEEVMGSDQGVAKWMRLIQKHGFSYVDNCPVSPEKTKELLERICFIRQTHYGGFYDFTADLTMKDTAYTAEALDAHTDTTYFTDPIGYQMFHLLSHTNGSGGESLLVDGLRCATILANEDYEAFKQLRKTKLFYHSSGNEGISMIPNTVHAVLDAEYEPGREDLRLHSVRWNRYDRTTYTFLKLPSILERWYDAARKWNEILKRPENEYWEQLRPGRPLIFDNTRVLHGRSAFTGDRRMCGGYLNRDDFNSRFRTLHLTRAEILESV